jgi:hypothetical protein
MNDNIDIRIARVLMPEIGTPAAESCARSRTQLLAYVGARDTEVRRRRRVAAKPFALRARFVGAVVGAAAAAGVVIAAVGGSGVVNPPPASAATILARAADAVNTSAIAADPGPGQYLFTKEIWVSAASDSRSNDADGNPVSIEVTQDVDTWQSAQGGVQTRETTMVNGVAVNPSGILEGTGHGPYQATRYGTIQGTLGLSGSGLGGYTYAQLQAMPTATAGLQAYLERYADNGSAQSDTQAWTNHEMFSEIHDILIEQLVPANLRAALYKVAATIPGVTLLGQSKDAAGKPSLVITFNDPLYNERDELYFDPTTYLMTGESEVNNATGKTEESQAIVQSQIVNQPPTALQGIATSAGASSR